MRAHNIDPKSIKLAFDKKANDWRRNSTNKIEYVCQDREPPHRLRYFSTDCDRVEDATSFVRGLKADLLEHEVKDVEATVAEVAETYLKDKAHIRNRDHMFRSIVRAFGDRRFSSLTHADIVDFRAERLKTVQESTLRNELGRIKTLRKYAIKIKMIPREKAIDFVDIDLPEVQPTDRDALTMAQVDRLWALLVDYVPYANRSTKEQRLSRVARFGAIAIDTGARREAIETLKWKQVDFEHGLIHFDLHLDRVIPKNKRRAKCPISPRLEALLRQAQAESRSEFVCDHPGSIDFSWRSAVRGTEFDGVFPHLLRHSFITHMFMRGVDSLVIGKIVGDSVQTLARYEHVKPDYLRDQVRWGSTKPSLVDLNVERAKRSAA
jgi:integrase